MMNANATIIDANPELAVAIHSTSTLPASELDDVHGETATFDFTTSRLAAALDRKKLFERLARLNNECLPEDSVLNE